MSWQPRSLALAAALAAAVTVPAVTGTALAVLAAAGTARTASSSLVIWGADTGKILGPWAGMGNATRPRPLPIAASSVASTRIGCFSGYVLTTAGQILAWGDDRVGQLGNGSTVDHSRRPVLVRLPAGTAVRQISGEAGNGIVLTSTGRILMWGENGIGQLGIGTTSLPSRVPVAVHLPAGQTAVSVGTGWDSSNALAITRSRR